MFFLFLCGSRTAGGGRREKMAKFLNYEDRLEIQNGLKEHLTFTEIGKRTHRSLASGRRFSTSKPTLPRMRLSMKELIHGSAM